MRVLKTFLAAVCLTGAGSQAYAVTPWTPVDKPFVEIPPPSTRDLHAARFGSRSWQVRFKGEQLLIVPDAQNNPPIPFNPEIDTATMGYYGTQPSEALKVSNGWFLAYYHGEFGGGLWQFNAGGTVGRRLIDDPTYGLLRYGGDVLAVTQDNSMMVRMVRIHRFALRNGLWQEVSHADFSSNLGTLTLIGTDLYATAADTASYPTAGLAKLDLAGHITLLWPFHHDLRISHLARSQRGDFSLSGTGYVVRLHRAARGFIATWYAPPDCVTYTNVEEADGAQSRCRGMPGVPSFERHSLVPMRDPLVTSNGEWMLSRFPPYQLLHLTGSKWLPAQSPQLATNEFPQQIQQIGAQLLLRTSRGIWRGQNGQWRLIRADEGCPLTVAFSSNSSWGVGCGDPATITRTGSDGTVTVLRAQHGNPVDVFAGLFDDAWFSEKDSAFIGHATANGNVEEIATSSPIASISRGSTRVWFTEHDKVHYGFIDDRNRLHEMREEPRDIQVLSVSGAKTTAWLRETFVGRTMIYHADDPTRRGTYIADVRTAMVSPDGSVWALGNNWLTVIHNTESGEMASYRLPCLDPHLRFFPAPHNGLWIQSYERGCNALIDASGMHVRDLPEIERIDYK